MFHTSNCHFILQLIRGSSRYSHFVICMIWRLLGSFILLQFPWNSFLPGQSSVPLLQIALEAANWKFICLATREVVYSISPGIPQNSCRPQDPSLPTWNWIIYHSPMTLMSEKQCKSLSSVVTLLYSTWKSWCKPPVTANAKAVTFHAGTYSSHPGELPYGKDSKQAEDGAQRSKYDTEFLCQNR